MGECRLGSQVHGVLQIPTIRRCLQVSGYICSKDGTKRLTLNGKWNSFLEMQKCNEEGEPLPGSEPVRLWTVSLSALVHDLS